ncbi:conserved hypothetical protein [Candidatus Methylobacter favarea]|uniref:DUF3261 domain-containing protein n=2 Tax=Candidatus Methylobacter favarea TaxID=2707345 RepID=A0A8S0X967_9GAMM|nr:conserved hypothetical protein [Candidatus Methylobacter favarea]
MTCQFVKVLIFTCVLSGCAAFDKQEVSGQPVVMPIAPPVGPARRIVQQITALWPGRQEILVCVLELDERHIAMAGLSNEGLSLFNLTYDGKKLELDKSPLLPDTMAPEFIITDLQLAYWPIAMLQKILPAQWRLEAGQNHRHLYYQNQKRVDVNYLSSDAGWPKDVELINYPYNYRLRIKTISYTQ